MEAEVVEAEALRVEAEVIQKLSFPHPWLDQFILFLTSKFKFRFIDFEKTKSNSNLLTLQKSNSNLNSNSSITRERIQIQNSNSIQPHCWVTNIRSIPVSLIK